MTVNLRSFLLVHRVHSIYLGTYVRPKRACSTSTYIRQQIVRLLRKNVSSPGNERYPTSDASYLKERILPMQDLKHLRKRQ